MRVSKNSFKLKSSEQLHKGVLENSLTKEEHVQIEVFTYVLQESYVPSDNCGEHQDICKLWVKPVTFNSNTDDSRNCG